MDYVVTVGGGVDLGRWFRIDEKVNQKIQLRVFGFGFEILLNWSVFWVIVRWITSGLSFNWWCDIDLIKDWEIRISAIRFVTRLGKDWEEFE